MDCFFQAVPLTRKISRGFYAEGVWAENGFIPYHQIGGIAWRQGEPPTLLLISRFKELARPRTYDFLHYGATTGSIGYDSLTVPQGTVAGPSRVIVEARLTGWSERLHNVEYVAVSVPSGAERPAATDPLLVRGSGRTLHVAC